MLYLFKYTGPVYDSFGKYGFSVKDVYTTASSKEKALNNINWKIKRDFMKVDPKKVRITLVMAYLDLVPEYVYNARDVKDDDNHQITLAEFYGKDFL